ncbi:LysR family transcriptional regulator [Neisseriaceae bacterium ESL0693]|nr:LysR family transcriptional regulator [Neisseriaceae bacterium ESL0693]
MKDLLIFKTIYEMKTLNRAAKHLGYTQSNISARLQKMEHELRTLLFIRNYDGVQVTEQGARFYDFAINTLTRLGDIKTGFNRKKSRLLTSELLFKFLVVEKEQYSVLATDIMIKKSSEIEQELSQHCYDNVICFNPLIHHHYQRVATEPLMVGLLQGNLEESKTDLPIFMNSDATCPLRQLTLELWPDTDRLIEIDSLENLLQLVIRKQGMAVLLRFLISADYQPVDHQTYVIDYYHYQPQ